MSMIFYKNSDFSLSSIHGVLKLGASIVSPGYSPVVVFHHNFGVPAQIIEKCKAAGSETCLWCTKLLSLIPGVSIFFFSACLIYGYLVFSVSTRFLINCLITFLALHFLIRKEIHKSKSYYNQPRISMEFD